MAVLILNRFLKSRLFNVFLGVVISSLFWGIVINEQKVINRIKSIVDRLDLTVYTLRAYEEKEAHEFERWLIENMAADSNLISLKKDQLDMIFINQVAKKYYSEAVNERPQRVEKILDEKLSKNRAPL
ncbi:hypothetical protein QSV34_00380 [Porticoccus sp. W117]|uniref:hypothetical protein n=1 Tax=Porticoccus sp. W117 TaxID=3054777 RepID=UPI002597ED90|nr:hypothetical protein [Porticoccus sp. W117]MDM3869798.1 hypothetical protein [Porticoccus sp. W117]